jgi:outer membrane lipoprotein SlyB
VSRHQAYQKLNYDSVVAKEDIIIGGTHSGIGACIGSAAAIHDSTSHSLLGFIVRRIVGSIVGSIAEEAITRQEGVLYTIELNHSAIVEVVSNDESFASGEYVRVAHAGHRNPNINPAPAIKCSSQIVNIGTASI